MRGGQRAQEHCRHGEEACEVEEGKRRESHQLEAEIAYLPHSRPPQSTLLTPLHVLLRNTPPEICLIKIESKNFGMSFGVTHC